MTSIDHFLLNASYRIDLTFVDLPVAFGVKSHLEEAVFGIVTFAASGADHVAAPGGAFAVVVFGDGEGGAAAARD